MGSFNYLTVESFDLNDYGDKSEPLIYVINMIIVIKAPIL